MAGWTWRAAGGRGRHAASDARAARLGTWLGTWLGLLGLHGCSGCTRDTSSHSRPVLIQRMRSTREGWWGDAANRVRRGRGLVTRTGDAANRRMAGCGLVARRRRGMCNQSMVRDKAAGSMMRDEAAGSRWGPHPSSSDGDW